MAQTSFDTNMATMSFLCVKASWEQEAACASRAACASHARADAVAIGYAVSFSENANVGTFRTNPKITTARSGPKRQSNPAFQASRSKHAASVVLVHNLQGIPKP